MAFIIAAIVAAVYFDGFTIEPGCGFDAARQNRCLKRAGQVVVPVGAKVEVFVDGKKVKEE